ncbi:MAG: glucosaminidase domain-containing protein [Eubacteriaceae bacterium]
MKKIILTAFMCLLVFTSVIIPVNIVGEDTATATATLPYHTKIAKADGTFTDVCGYATYNEAYAAMSASSDVNMVVTSNSHTYNGGVVAMKDGIAVSAASSTINLYITGTTTKYTYITTSHMLYYYATTSSTKAKVGISGFIGEALLSQLVLIPRIQVIGQSYYYVDDDGDIIHKFSTFSTTSRTPSYHSYTYLKAPSFMKKSVKYYSLDGRTFYTNPQLTNLAGTLSNYYNILPVRSKTKYTAAELNYYISLLDKPTSVLNGKAQVFIDAQNKYGTNAAIILSIAFLESAYGTSYFATTRYNLFGLNAGDSDPNNASYYSSVAACVNYMTGDFISDGYCDANTDFRYYGPNLGNKQQGFNVYYASDPYWGQKIAGMYYKIDRKLGYKDQYAYNLGISNKTDYVYYTPFSTLSMYKMAMKTSSYPVGIPVILLDASNPTYYKIQSDMPINDVTGLTDCYALYDYANDVGYVKKTSIKIIGPSTLIDKTLLNQLIVEAEALDKTKYTAATVSALEAAYDAAVAERDNVTTTQAKIDAAYNNLKTAYDALSLYVAVTGVTLDKTSVSITDNLSPVQLTATISPADASVKTVTWSSSDAAIASVSNGGLVTFHKNGTATITAKSNDTKVDFSAACTVTISVTAAGSDTYGIDYINGIIYNVDSNTDTAAFLNNVVLPDGYTAGIYSGSTLVDSGIIKTGMMVKMSDGSDNKTYTVAVKGDLNGDGNVSISDLISVRDYILGQCSLDGACKLSGDLNGDNNVSISDLVSIVDIILGK